MDEKAKKIVDGLRCCNEIPHDCTKKGCYLASSKRICVMALRDDAADLIERLSEELDQVKRERDAAINDMRKYYGLCSTCKHKDGVKCKLYEEGCKPCKWQWRGVCAENSKDGAE